MILQYRKKCHSNTTNNFVIKKEFGFETDPFVDNFLMITEHCFIAKFGILEHRPVLLTQSLNELTCVSLQMRQSPVYAKCLMNVYA